MEPSKEGASPTGGVFYDCTYSKNLIISDPPPLDNIKNRLRHLYFTSLCFLDLLSHFHLFWLIRQNFTPRNNLWIYVWSQAEIFLIHWETAYSLNYFSLRKYKMDHIEQSCLQLWSCVISLLELFTENKNRKVYNPDGQ